MKKKYTLKVIPRSSKNLITKQKDESYTIRLMAAPVDGEANKQLIALLAKEWNIKKYQISIISGQNSHKKIIEIDT
ncbi:DUF167 domain-containing protein [Patescibacteria group bacterium]|nr:DUF167 domain-containing protein [Patescibacteria group bacterium]MBU1721300.1 DUF167 domain-containing protein [Patescibacteria group bacterium]MBU1900824.1 DUF167 domain-containing protein [Patescibacteria group bacterium]